MASGSSSSSTGGSNTSEYLQSTQRVLKKKQIKDIVADLEALKSKEVLEKVKTEVSAGYHLQFFPERRAFWDACIRNQALDGFVDALFKQYAALLGQCFQGREKYAKFQLQWMELVRSLLHEPADDSHPVGKEWGLLVRKAAQEPSCSTKGAMIISVCKAVFDVCQQHIVKFKEGEVLLLDREQDMDPFEEVGSEADEAALYRLGGFALFSCLKSSDHLSEEKRSVLKTLRLPLEEKTELPSNIQHLDKGTLTLLKKEMLGYLSQVCI